MLHVVYCWAPQKIMHAVLLSGLSVEILQLELQLQLQAITDAATHTELASYITYTANLL